MEYDCCSLLQPKPKFRLIGHRGVPSLRPENTMSSFKHAYNLGLNWIEMDARLTKCGSWVIFHDDDLKRISGSSSCIEDLDLNELLQIDIGSWFSGEFHQERIPTLHEIIKYASDNQIFINLEIKTSNKIPTSTYAKKLMVFLKESLPPNTPYPLISSFNTALLVELRKMSSQLRLGYLIEEFNNEVWKNIDEYHFSTVNSYELTTGFDDIQKTKTNNIPSLVYTVNDTSRAKELFEFGVCGIFTDKADLMMTL